LELRGFTPRLLEALFEESARRAQAAQENPGLERVAFNFSIEFLEIYNENLKGNNNCKHTHRSFSLVE
jgi:hypothetical protein